MNGFKLLAAAPLLFALGACATQSEAKTTPHARTTPASTPARPVPPPALTAAQKTFIASMREKYGFSEAELATALRRPERKDVIALMTRPAEKTKPWYEYRPIFITDARANAGVAFWQEHADALARAEKTYGVPAQFIVAIIGVETYYGKIKGKIPVLDALNTLAFYYPPRAPFFTSELEAYLLLARSEDWRYDLPTGSYAGAMGYGQFMPSNYRTLAVDFNGNGHKDLIGDPVDAIGSVANYLKHHGWQNGGPLVQSVKAPASALEQLKGKDYRPRLGKTELDKAGVKASPSLPADVKAAYLELATGPDTTGQWLTYQNFYVITRYNKSPMYAMAVTELAGQIKSGYNQSQSRQAQR